MLAGGVSIHGCIGILRGGLAIFAALVLVLTFASCGTSASESAPRDTPTSDLLQPSDFSRYPQGSAERTFLEFWSDLQFQSWANVAAYYHPDFRESVGTTAVIGAKKLNGSTYPLLTPKIVRVKTTRGETTVYYTLKFEDGSKELESVLWRRDGNNRQIIYDSRLDTELSQLAQNRVEIKRIGSLSTGSSRPPSPRAARAAYAAAQLQAHFREQELSVSSP